MPDDKTVVLGLVTTKVAEPESPDLLNEISEVDQWARLELVVNTAREIWVDYSPNWLWAFSIGWHRFLIADRFERLA